MTLNVRYNHAELCMLTEKKNNISNSHVDIFFNVKNMKLDEKKK